jgi:type II secretory pathway pseudopilin PulG
VGERCSERGVAMLSTLIVVIILGVLATVVLTHSPGSKPASPANSSIVATTTISTTPKSIGTEAQLAALSGCASNYLDVSTAVQTYDVENGSMPPAGSAWATSTSGGGPFLQSWPSDPKYYAIDWNGTTIDVIPAKGVASHGSMGTTTPPTGCYGS